jgi:hypothetical protein
MAGIAATTASTMFSNAGDDALAGISSVDTAKTQFVQAEIQEAGTQNAIDALESQYEQSVQVNAQTTAKNAITTMEIH